MNKQKTFIFFMLLLWISIAFAVSPLDLADQDSRFVDIKGIDIHYKVEGDSEQVMLMFHGFGSSTFTWNFIRNAFVQDFMLVSYDRPAFGLTERIVNVDDYEFNFYNFYNQSQLAYLLMKSIEINPGNLF